MAATASITIDRWSRWVNTWTGLSLPGVGFAVLAWGPVNLLIVAAMVAVLVALVLVMVEHDRWVEGERSLAQVGGWVGRVVLCAVAFVVSTLALSALSPGAALLVLVAGATTPPALGVVRRALGPTTPTTTPGTPLQAVEVMGAQRLLSRLADEAAQQMSDPELCRAWRNSFWALRAARDSTETLALVLQRQAFLDEMEARHQGELQVWLASGAGPSGGPERFLDDGGGDQTTERRSP